MTFQPANDTINKTDQEEYGMNRKIEVFDYAKEIVSAIPKGVLLTTKNGDTFVREGRFTRELLDASGEFTVNVPYGAFDRKILGYCGTKSGRNSNKISELGLTLVASEVVKAPGIKELPLTLECKVLYRQLQDRNAIPEEIRRSMYPEGADSSCPGANRDYHVAYYGQIVNAYIIE